MAAGRVSYRSHSLVTGGDCRSILVHHDNRVRPREQVLLVRHGEGFSVRTDTKPGWGGTSMLT